MQTLPRAALLLSCALCLFLGSARTAAAQNEQAGLEAIRSQTPTQLESEILVQRERVDLRVIDVLGERADPRALETLFLAERVLVFDKSRARVYDAFAKFADSPELRRTLENLPEGYLFNLIFFEAKLRSWKKRLTAMTLRVRRTVLNFVERQDADGGTALYDAVAKALADPQVDTIVILSDGGTPQWASSWTRRRS